MNYVYGFEKLEVWQNARLFVKDVYLLTGNFSNSEKFGLTSQMQRAAISVASNIAEGSGRMSANEQRHFFEIAFGSLMETYSQICLANDLNYISNSDIDNIKPLIDKIASQLSLLRKRIIEKENEDKDQQ